MKSQRKRPPTMSDVARLAGVHRVTASVVLNEADASTQVSEATRQRILDAAMDLGYQPNAMALALRRQRTDILGFYNGYAADVHDPFTADVINGLLGGCGANRKDLLMYGAFERRSADEIYASLASGKIDGLIVIPAPDNPVIDRLVASHLPIVTIANSIPNMCSVTVDDEEGSRLLAEHLASKGHRRILYRKDRTPHTSSMRRFAALKEVASTFGMEVIESLPGDWHGNLSAEEEVCLLDPSGERLTAAICWVDTVAYALLRNCERLGIRVPDDLAVVGFDGIETRLRPAHRLTTIRAPWRRVAEKAVDLLLALIDGEEVPHETVFPVELVVGDTT